MDLIGVFNIILTIVSAICTGISIYSAWKGKSYYKNSKNLATYKDVSIAYTECQTIIETFSELFCLANERSTIGKNVDKLVSEYGKNMKSSLNKIRANTYEKNFKQVKEFLDSHESEIEVYVDSLISGEYVDNNLFIKNKDAKIWENNIKRIQELIKDRLDTVAESLK